MHGALFNNLIDRKKKICKEKLCQLRMGLKQFSIQKVKLMHLIKWERKIFLGPTFVRIEDKYFLLTNQIMTQRFRKGTTNDNKCCTGTALQAMSLNHFSCLMDDPICENYIVSIQPNSGQFAPDGQTPLPLELSVFIITFTNTQLQYNITLSIKH